MPNYPTMDLTPSSASPYSGAPYWTTDPTAPSLPSRQTTYNTTSFMPTGSSGSSLGSLDTGGGVGKQYDWGKIIATGGSLASSLLAPDATDVTGPTKEAQDAARKLGANASSVLGQGGQALGPVLHYLAAINSGDPSAILQATMPERRRVLDQYDTAKQAVQFQPRGGGTSSAMVDLGAREASDLAMLSSKARTDALKMGADLGTNLTGAGLSGENAAAGHMANLLGPIMKQHEQDQQSTWQTFASIASLAMMFASDRDLKEDIEPFTGRVLDKLSDLPIATWSYKGDSTRHLGPMAQDFQRVLGVGDGKTIHMADVAGVTLQSLKELGEKIDALGTR